MARGGDCTVHTNYWSRLVARRPDWGLILLRSPHGPELDLPDLGSNCCYLYGPPSTNNVYRRILWQRRWLPKLVRAIQCSAYIALNGVTQSKIHVPQIVLFQDPTPFFRRIYHRAGLRGRIRASLLRWLWRRSVRQAAATGYTSNYMRSLILHNAKRTAEKRHFIAYNGIDDSMRRWAATMSPRPLEQRQPVILSVSGNHLHKNFETLIRAIGLLRARERFREYRLRIMGWTLVPSYLQRLRELVEQLGLSEGVALDFDQSQAEIAKAYQESALFSLTSMCESFGIPSVEAMAYGLPCVLGATTAVPEIADDAAVLVPPTDPQLVADAWERVLSDTSLYRNLQEAGQRRCLDFSWDQTVSNWIDAIENAIGLQGTMSASRARATEQV